MKYAIFENAPDEMKLDMLFLDESRMIILNYMLLNNYTCHYDNLLHHMNRYDTEYDLGRSISDLVSYGFIVKVGEMKYHIKYQSIVDIIEDFNRIQELLYENE